MMHGMSQESGRPTGRSGRSWCHIAKTAGNAAMDISATRGTGIEKVDLEQPVSR
jgi:hypothetical protein